MAMVLEKTLTTHLAVLLTALLKFALLWTERSNTGGASITSRSIATMVIVWANKEIFGKVSSQRLVKLSLSLVHTSILEHQGQREVLWSALTHTTKGK